MKQFSMVSLLVALSVWAAACSKGKNDDSNSAKVEQAAPSEAKPATKSSPATKPAQQTETKAVSEASAVAAAPKPADAVPKTADADTKPATGGTTEPTPDKPNTPTKITHLDAKAAHESVLAKVVVLDIRTPAEFAEGHIEGALNIDFNAGDFADKIDKLDKSQEYLVHCRSGGRSGRSLPTFETLGFEKILHLDGGMIAWVEAGLSTKK